LSPLELTLSKIPKKIQSLRPAASRRKAAACLAEKLPSLYKRKSRRAQKQKNVKAIFLQGKDINFARAALGILPTPLLPTPLLRLIFKKKRRLLTTQYIIVYNYN
jgi:hypothetical protein